MTSSLIPFHRPCRSVEQFRGFLWADVGAGLLRKRRAGMGHAPNERRARLKRGAFAPHRRSL
jgi:hypothetical protein